MTKEEFIKELKDRDYEYEVDVIGGKIVVKEGDHQGRIYLSQEFYNYNKIESIPSDVYFKNRLTIYLSYLKSLPPGVVFENGGSVRLDNVQRISPSVEFSNGGKVSLQSLMGGLFDYWEGNIKGIDSKRLLNKMVKDGLFNR